MEKVGPGADWRDAAAYAPLLGADRSIFAWEWLRRDPGYREAALPAFAGGVGGGAAKPGHWGLCALEDPNLAAPFARPIWTRAVHPAVLVATAEVNGVVADRIALEGLAGLVTLLRGDGVEHILLSDGLRAVRLDIVAGSLAREPARLRYLLAGLASAEPHLLTLRRLLMLCRGGRFSRSLHLRESRASRWLLMLRAHDALAAGAGQREVAAILLGRSAAEPRWRSEASSLRSQVQRLIRGARRMEKGGWRELLR
jgi:hypothetical protein